MDQPYSHITPGLTLRSDNVPGVFPAHLGNPASPSRQLLSRVTSPGTLTKLLQQLERQNRGGGGFYNPTAGIAAVYLVLLRHPPTRKGLLLFFGASPADFRSDEHLARALAVAWMFYSLLKMRDAEVNERFDQFAHGSAHRVKIDSVQALAHLINNFAPSQAYALGRLKEGVPDGAKVVRKEQLNGATHVIARTQDFLIFKKGDPGLVLLDVDLKGMPEDTKRRMEECEGHWGALCEALPALKTAARVERASTSSGLRNTETVETFPSTTVVFFV